MFPNQYYTAFFDQIEVQFVLKVACKKCRSRNWSVLIESATKFFLLTTLTHHPHPLNHLPSYPENQTVTHPLDSLQHKNLQHCLLLTSDFCHFFCPSSMRYMVALRSTKWKTPVLCFSFPFLLLPETANFP